MILYRARTTASRPRRQPEYQGNAPAQRVRGRWFTSSLAAAVAHRATLTGETEVVCVDVPDAIADSFRVATRPVTACGIEAALHSSDPDTDYILPMFRIMEATAIAVAGQDRHVDYIDIHAPVAITRRIALARGTHTLPMAA